MTDLRGALRGVLSMIDDADGELDADGNPIKPMNRDQLDDLVTDIYGFVEKALEEEQPV